MLTAPEATKLNLREAIRAAREWTTRTEQEFLPFLTNAILDYLQWDQIQPRCGRCNSLDLIYVEGDFPTGVVAPDGGREYWHSEFNQCGRCGWRQEIKLDGR